MKTKEELVADLEKLSSATQSILEQCNKIKESLNNEEIDIIDRCPDHLGSDVSHQIWRSNIAKRAYSDDSEETRELEKELEKDKQIFENNDIQSILDSFDWDECVDTAEKLGYKYGVNEKTITKERLVEDALEMFIKLESSDTKCGRLQVGRLLVNKFWDFEEKAPWYTMNFFIENNEAY
jgi:hypothetical protein